MRASWVVRVGVFLAVVVGVGGGVLVEGCVGDAAPPSPGDAGSDADVAVPDVAAPVDAAEGGPVSLFDASCPPFASFCDDFEVGDLRRWKSPIATPPTSYHVDSSGAYRGAFGVRFATTENRDAGVVVRTSAGFQVDPFEAPVTSGSIGVRFHVRLTVKPSDNTTFFWVTKGEGDVASVLSARDGAWLAESVSGSLGTPPGLTSAAQIPLGRWLCVEWSLDVAAAGRQQVFLDGNPEPVLRGPLDTAGTGTAGYSEAYLLVANQGAATQELRFDQVAIATFAMPSDVPRMGCVP